MNKNLLIKISLAINFIVFAILLNSVGTVIFQVINTYDIPKFEASILEQYKDLTIAVVSFLVGSFIPKLGFKKSMLMALGVITLVCFYMPFTDAFWHTKLLFGVIGFTFAIIKVSAYSTVGLVTSSAKEHSSLMNTLEGLFMVGVLIGYWLFAFYIDESNSNDWLNVYWIVGVLSLVAFVFLLISPLDESAIEDRKETAISEDFRDMLALIIKPLIIVFVISAFLYVLIEQGIGTWLPTFNNEILNLPRAMSVQLTSILAAASALGRLVAGQVLKKYDWLKVLSASLVICIMLILVSLPLTYNVSSNISSWSQAPLAAFIFPLFGFFLAPVYPAINSVVLSSLPKGMHAAMTGLIVVFSALGGTTGSRITGFVFEKFSGQTAFYGCIIPVVLLMLSLYFLNRYTLKSKGNHE